MIIIILVGPRLNGHRLKWCFYMLWPVGSEPQVHKNASIPFMEVFVDAPLASVESRDPKGLYKLLGRGTVLAHGSCEDPPFAIFQGNLWKPPFLS